MRAVPQQWKGAALASGLQNARHDNPTTLPTIPEATRNSLRAFDPRAGLHSARGRLRGANARARISENHRIQGRHRIRDARSPADCVADLQEVRRLLGLREIRLAMEFELAQMFPECELGAMPPLANFFDMPLLMDERIASADFMAFNAGTHRDVIHMSVADFHKLVNPLVASFALVEPVAIS